jgi:septin family protein
LHAQARTHAPLPKVRNVFAVVCDTSDSGKREYPWGALDIYDEEHSDFRRLQRVILDSDNITEFIKQTQDMSLRLLRLESAATSESFPAAKMTSPEKTKAAGKKTPSAVGERSTETPRALSLTLPSQCAAPLTTGTAPTTAAARSERETRSAGRAVRAQAIKWPQWSTAPESLHLMTAASGGVLTILSIAALYSLWVVLAKIYSIEA